MESRWCYAGRNTPVVKYGGKVGFLLPVSVENLGRMGETVRAVDLKPGDLVFFNTMRRTFSHVGIYLGNNKFIHAPAKGSEVRVDDLQSAYWDRRFEGARRITTQGITTQVK